MEDHRPGRVQVAALAKIILGSASLALLSLSAACVAEVHTLTWQNSTDQYLLIDIGDDPDDFAAELMPCSTKEQHVTRYFWDGVVIVRSSLGVELYRTKVSWNELKANGYKVVIRPDWLPAPELNKQYGAGPNYRCPA